MPLVSLTSHTMRRGSSRLHWVPKLASLSSQPSWRLILPQALFGSIGVLDDDTDAALYPNQSNKHDQSVYTVSLNFTLPKPASSARISFTLPANQSVTSAQGAQIKMDGELVVLTANLSAGGAMGSTKGSVEFDVKLNKDADAGKKVNSFQIAGL
jgi:hypothetical protein